MDVPVIIFDKNVISNTILQIIILKIENAMCESKFPKNQLRSFQ